MHRVELNAKAGKKQRVESNAEAKGECRGWENNREECEGQGGMQRLGRNKRGRRGMLMLWRNV
jgi:hypothetical protein